MIILKAQYLILAIVCPAVGHPENGQAIQSGNTPGSTVSYQCDDGYELQSGASSTRTCGNNGLWTGIAPVCEGTSGDGLVQGS